MRPFLRFLSDEQRERIAEATADLLETVGVQLTEPVARELLHGAGARIDGDHVTIPAGLLEQAIRSAPKGISIYDRQRQPVMQLEGDHVYFGAHTDAPDVLDPFTHERRPCNEADVVRHARLIQALPRIDYCTASGLVAGRPAHVGDRVSLARCLQHATKPVLAMPVSPRALTDCHRLAALAAGGEDELRQRPMLIIYAEPVSPLVQPDEPVQKLLYCAEHRIPIVYSAYAAMGGTAPMSQAAIIAQLCAETLSGLVIHQLKRGGAPFIFGGMASLMDMRTTVFSYGAPEFQRGNTLMAEMAHHFQLPNFGTAGTSDSQRFDGQAMAEATSSCLMAALVGANLVHDVGLLGNATVVMPEMIVATNEVIGMVQPMLAGVAVDEESLALAVLAAVGPGGEFVTHDHTLAHFREAWYPDLFYRGGAKGWRESGQKSFEQQVNARTRALLETADPSPLPDEIVSQFDQILTRAEHAEGNE